jgi:hypothetical protein
VIEIDKVMRQTVFLTQNPNEGIDDFDRPPQANHYSSTKT